MKLFRQWLPFLVFVFASVAVSQQLDVSGIQMGMSMEQAKAKIGSGFVFSEKRLNDPATALEFALKNSEAWAFETINGRVVYVFHYVKYLNGSQPNLSDTQNRLVQKYGPPAQNSDWHWGFSPSGEPLKGAYNPTARACIDGWKLADLHMPAPFNGTVYVPWVSPQGCGVSLSAYMYGGGSGLVSEFRVTMIDLHALGAEGARSAAAQQQQQNDSLNKAKQNKAVF